MVGFTGNSQNAGEFNRRYLTCQISAILHADRRLAYKIAKCVAGFIQADLEKSRFLNVGVYCSAD